MRFETRNASTSIRNEKKGRVRGFIANKRIILLQSSIYYLDAALVDNIKRTKQTHLYNSVDVIDPFFYIV